MSVATLKIHSFLFRILCSVFMWHWWCVASIHVRFWVFRYSLWRMLCNYSLVGCDV